MFFGKPFKKNGFVSTFNLFYFKKENKISKKTINVTSNKKMQV